MKIRLHRRPASAPLTAEDFLARRRGWSGPLGMTMKADDDPDDDDDDDDDDPIELDPDTKVKVGDKTMTVRDLQRIAAKEKREGKKAGVSSLLARLGVKDEAELEAALAAGKKSPASTKKDGDDKDDAAAAEAARRAQEREDAADKREREAVAKARRSDLRGALREHGVPRADLDDALAMLDRKVDADYDEDDVDDAIEELKGTRAGAALFADDGEDDDADDDKTAKAAAKRPARGKMPSGRKSGRNKPPAGAFGQAGLERAKQRGWIKADDK